jgi:hypothetical protein
MSIDLRGFKAARDWAFNNIRVFTPSPEEIHAIIEAYEAARAAPAEQGDECRAEFEGFARAHGYGCHKYSDGDYRAIEWQQKWLGFKVAWNLRSPMRELAEIAKTIHYPDCWDTAAYPTIYSALNELAGCVGCSECKYPGVNPDAGQKPTPQSDKAGINEADGKRG